jgi:hypothetical protein
MSTDSTRLDDIGQVDVLRAVRDKAIEDVLGMPNSFPGVIVVEPANFVRAVADETFVMSLRDDPPFTAADGTWSPP